MRKAGIKTLIAKNNQIHSSILSLDAEAIRLLKNTSSVLLAVIASAGAIALSVAAPNTIAAIGAIAKQVKGGKKKPIDPGKRLSEAVYYLKRSGKIKIKPAGGDFILSLTKLGMQKAKDFDLETLHVLKPKTWNKKWWLVAADIPTKQYRWAADLFRKKLREMSFFPLQKTLWLYPYNPTSQLQFLMQYYGIEHFGTVMEISLLDEEDEDKAKRFFKSRGIL